MASPHFSTPPPAQRDSSQDILNWFVTILACAYIAWIGITLFQSTTAFAAMFASMGVQLSAATIFVMHNYFWYCPVLFGGAVALLIAKQFFIRDKWKNLALTFAAVVLIDFVANGIVQALYRPLFEIMEKLNK
jgi:hypothetical protein